MKIGSKLILIVALLVVICISISAAVYYSVAGQTIEKRIEAQLESIAVLKENQFNDFIEGRMKDVESIAKEKFFVENFAGEQKVHAGQEAEPAAYHQNIMQLLSERLADKKNFLEFFILDMDGQVHLSTDEAQEGNFRSNEPYFTEGRNGTYLQNFYYDAALQQPATTISAPIRDDEGNVIGILAGRVDLNRISSIMTERSGLGETGETYLVNKYSLLVSKSRFVEGIEFKNPVHTEGIKNCLKEGGKGHGYYTSYRDIPVVGFYVWLPDNEICLLAEISQEEAFEPIKQLEFNMILLSIIMIPLVDFIGIVLSRTITKPIKKLRNAAEEIGKGNLDAKAEIKSKDEFGQLASAFNQMTEDLKKSGAKLKEYSKGLETQVAERTKELESKVDELERFNKLSVGRELRMIELKKRIAELEGRKARKGAQ